MGIRARWPKEGILVNVGPFAKGKQDAQLESFLRRLPSGTLGRRRTKEEW